MRKKRVIVIIIVLSLLLVIGISFAYFVGQIGPGKTVNVNLTSGKTDSLNFTVGNAINIHATQQNFTRNDGNLSGSTTAKAILTANNGSTTQNYNVYLRINSNNFIYTTANHTAELVLKVTSPTGSTQTISGLTSVTSGGVTGYDITTKTGFIPIATNYAITSSSTKTDTWTVQVSFINLSTSQKANGGKVFNAEVIITTDEASLLTINPNGGTWNGTTANSGYTQLYGTEMTIPNPTRSGYTFNGWTLTGAGWVGQSLHTDGTFNTSINGVGVYNNTGNGTVTVTRKAANSDNIYGDYELEVVSSSTATPGYGGFVNGTGSAADQQYIHVFIAKLPSDNTFYHAMNATGTGRTVQWITERQGTDKYTVYIYKLTAGSTGTFSSFGHVYVVASNRVPTFYVAESDVLNITNTKTGTIKYVFGEDTGTLTAQWSSN